MYIQEHESKFDRLSLCENEIIKKHWQKQDGGVSVKNCVTKE